MTEQTHGNQASTKKMALTQAEQEMILAHRRKTEVDRAFNAGLDYAIVELGNFGDFGPEVGQKLENRIANINRARRSV